MDEPKPEPVKLGEWYFTAPCKSCQRVFPFMKDPSQGKINFSGPGLLKMSCSYCKHEAEYGTDEIHSQKVTGILNMPLN